MTMTVAEQDAERELQWATEKAQDALESRRRQAERDLPILTNKLADIRHYLALLTECRDACQTELENLVRPEDRFAETRYFGVKADLEDTIRDCNTGAQKWTQGTRWLIFAHDRGLRPMRGQASIDAMRPRGINGCLTMIEALEADIEALS